MAQGKRVRALYLLTGDTKIFPTQKAAGEESSWDAADWGQQCLGQRFVYDEKKRIVFILSGKRNIRKGKYIVPKGLVEQENKKTKKIELPESLVITSNVGEHDAFGKRYKDKPVQVLEVFHEEAWLKPYHIGLSRVRTSAYGSSYTSLKGVRHSWAEGRLTVTGHIGAMLVEISFDYPEDPYPWVEEVAFFSYWFADCKFTVGLLMLEEDDEEVVAKADVAKITAEEKRQLAVDYFDVN